MPIDQDAYYKYWAVDYLSGLIQVVSEVGGEVYKIAAAVPGFNKLTSLYKTVHDISRSALDFSAAEGDTIDFDVVLKGCYDQLMALYRIS